MSLFALPFEQTSRSSTRPPKPESASGRKRKRVESPGTSSPESSLHSPSASTRSRTRSRSRSRARSAFEAASTNPLSLTPNEIAQYKLAGLDLDQQLPATEVPDFPHRRLPERIAALYGYDEDGLEGDLDEDGRDFKGKRREVEEEEDDADSAANETPSQRKRGFLKESRATMLRTQHLRVLTAILHRCLLSNDIPRATRAWSLLLRMEVSGKSFELRNSGYWGIGAELLLRAGNVPPPGPFRASDDHEMETEADENPHHREPELVPGGSEEEGKLPSLLWSRHHKHDPAALQKAKEYYERLILQHPYRRQFASSVNALDFYPALFTLEIYGIEQAHKAALNRIAEEERRWREGEGGSGDDDVDADENEEESENGMRYGEGYDEILNPEVMEEERWEQKIRRREARRLSRIMDRLWQRRDEARRAALAEAEKLVGRMDEIMTNPALGDSMVLKRLRGMIALWVGELSVPEALAGGDDDEAKGEEERDWFLSEREKTERRLRERERRVDVERGKERRKRELKRAREALEEVVKRGRGMGGAAEKDLLDGMLGGGDDDEEDGILNVERGSESD